MHFFITNFFVVYDDLFLSIIINDNFSLFIFLFIFLFSGGLFGTTLENKNFLLIFLFIELINASIIALFTLVAIFYFNAMGFIYSLLLLSVAATESAIGLSLLINYHFIVKNNYLSVSNLNFLKG
jgi:NADH-quinone oxidoreductase subunit K